MKAKRKLVPGELIAAAMKASGHGAVPFGQLAHAERQRVLDLARALDRSQRKRPARKAKR